MIDELEVRRKAAVLVIERSTEKVREAVFECDFNVIARPPTDWQWYKVFVVVFGKTDLTQEQESSDVVNLKRQRFVRFGHQVQVKTAADRAASDASVFGFLNWALDITSHLEPDEWL